MHALIGEHLEAVLQGEIQRLMIFAPPQHGKSELTSVRFPVFWLAHRPNDPVIITSYASSLASSKSAQGRAIVESPAFRALFPGIETDRESRAKDHWQLAGYRGGIIAAGVGGAITGHGAMLGIIDDPIENWEQAQSQTYRDRAWDWYRATFRTRIWEGGAIILIMTRWHEIDLAGRLLQDQGPLWTVLRLPALAETPEARDFNNAFLGLPEGEPDPLDRTPDEPLAPERFSREELERIRRDVGSIAWATEYQGVPRTPEGYLFKRHWFELVDAAPAKATRVRYWDKAGTEQGGSYTAGVLMARTEDGLYVIEDVVRGQWSALQRELVIEQTTLLDAHKYGTTGVHIWLEQEPGSGGKESAEQTVRQLAGYAVHRETVSGAKETRWEPFRAQCEAGNVKLVRGPWTGPFIEELTAQPNARFKDQTDAAGGAFNKLATNLRRRSARSYQG